MSCTVEGRVMNEMILISPLQAGQEAKHLATVLGGDTDTIGAMAGALVGGRYGASAPPSRWIKALETGPQGKDGLIECADRLYHRAVTAPGPTGGTDPGPAGMGP
jgi:hypothetical protein